jgi:pimeloyl-ACP methyl ester carboxylesterase
MQLEVLSSQPAGIEHPTPLLFVHGMYHAAWNWHEKFLPYFADHGYRAHAISLRGHGASEKPAHVNTPRIRDYVNDVAQVVDQLGVAPILIGHSMGGYIVQKYLETHEAPAAVLVASAPPSLGIWLSAFNLMRLNPLGFLKAALMLNLSYMLKTPEHYHRIFFADEFPRAQVEAYFPRVDHESFRAFLDLIGLDRVHPKRITTPLLVLGAMQDRIITPRLVRQTAHTYGVDPVLFERSGHQLPLDIEWKQVADRIIAWLGERGL